MYWNIKDVVISTKDIISLRIKCLTFKNLLKNLEPQLFVMHLSNQEPGEAKMRNIGSYMRVFTVYKVLSSRMFLYLS